MVFEGQPVDLAGIVVNARYNDGYKRITDPTKFTVSPRIYDWRYYNNWNSTGNLYTITYKEGFHEVSVTIPAKDLGIHRRLINVVYTGSMKKQEYLVDEYPDFDGLTFEGEYSDDDYWYGVSAPIGNTGNTQQIHYHKHLPVSLDIPEYQWRWVWNSASYATDKPGLLLKIGSYGSLWSPADINDPDSNWGSIDWTNVTPALLGTRVPVEKLYQVESIEFAEAPAYRTPVYFDDPSLIGPLNPVLAGNPGRNPERWYDDVFQDLKLTVKYYGTTETRTYPIRDVLDLTGGWVETDGVWNIGPPGGLWSALKVYPIDGDGNKVSRSLQEDGANPVVAWSEWAFLKQPKMRFEFRGLTRDTVVPIYTKLESVNVASRDGRLPEMNGSDLVHRTPDLLEEFVLKLKISATYSRTGDANQKSTREDVRADQEAGTLRWTYLDEDPNRGPQPVVGSTNILGANQGGILNSSTSLDYLNKQKKQKANVTFTATDDNNPRARAATIEIGVRNYPNPD